VGMNQYVVFVVNGDEFGLEIEKVSIIEKMLEVFKIPNTPDYIEGLANLRGKVHTIFNLRKRFHLPCPEFTEETRVIIAKTSDDSVIGLIVDGVREIIKIEDDQYEPAPAALVSVRDRFLSGTAKVGDRLILLLDLEKVITEEDIPPVKPEKKPSARKTAKSGKQAASADEAGGGGQN
jgi:purine-binding chemotaxis protein CheW